MVNISCEPGENQGEAKHNEITKPNPDEPEPLKASPISGHFAQDLIRDGLKAPALIRQAKSLPFGETAAMRPVHRLA